MRRLYWVGLWVERKRRNHRDGNGRRRHGRRRFRRYARHRRRFAGFSYTLQDGSFDGVRLKFRVSVGEIWKDWCALQTPIYDETNAGYGCVHNWGTGSLNGVCTQSDPQTGQTYTIDCGKIALCGFESVCACDAQSCSVTLNQGGPNFDMQLVPPSADGSVAGLDGSVHNVHLKKQ